MGRGRVALVAGGYTGGHIQCALAIAAALERAGTTCVLGGAEGGLEVTAAASAGHPIETVWIGALDRAVSARGLARKLRFLVQLAVSRHQARRVLLRVEPDVVVGVGGYPSAPFVLAAQSLGIPTLIHEANSLPGLANRFLGRRASVVCLGDGGAASYFPGGRSVVTGNPVRPGLAAVPAAAARARLGLRAEGKTLLVTGGSLGSPALNRWMRAAGPRLAQAGVQVVWQCGRAHSAALAGATPAPVAFLDDMAAAYGAADLVVASAGALTLAELAGLGKPAVLVPSPDVTEDHQAQNARALAARGVPVCGPDEVDARLLNLVLGLLADDERRRAAGTALASSARTGAAERIAEEALKLVRS